MRHHNTLFAARRTAQPAFGGHEAGLHWRGPWWCWQGLACVLSSLSAPTFVGIGALLMRDAHSDHPVFWAALMCIVPLANLLATVVVGQLHHRAAFASRKKVAAVYGLVATASGSVAFTLSGWATHFIQDFVLPMNHAGVGGVAMLASMAVALAYGVASFAHAGVVHAWLGFEYPQHEDPRPALG